MSDRVWWSAEERASIKKGFDLARKEGLGFATAVQKAQESLPPSRRRRNITHRAHAPWLDGKPDSRVAAILKREQVEEELEVEAHAREEMLKATVRAETLAGLRISDLVEIITQRIVESIDHAVERRLGAILTGIVDTRPDKRPHLPPPVPATPQTSRKVLVVGLKRVQHEEARKAGAERGLEIHSMEADRARTGGIPGGMDRVVIMTRFIDHGAQGRILKKYDKAAVIMHTKGVDTLKTQVLPQIAGYV